MDLVQIWWRLIPSLCEMDCEHAKERPKDQSLKFLCRAAFKCFPWNTYLLYNFKYRCFRQRKNYYFIPCECDFYFIFCWHYFVLFLSPVTFRREWKSGRESGRIWLNVGWKELQGRYSVLQRLDTLYLPSVSIFPLITEASQKSKCKSTPTTFTRTVWSCNTINEFWFKICLKMKANL